jgi:glycosyltransferase involved in cell wall biosynthesis
MKVALVSYDFGEYSIRLAGGLADFTNVLLLLPSELSRSQIAALDRRIILKTFAKPRLRQPLRQLRTGWQLVRHIRAFNPDVVHFQHGHLWFNGFFPLLRRFPLVVTVHDPRHHPGDRVSQKTPQAVMDFGFRRASQLIVHAAPLKQVLTDRCRIHPERVHVVPHVSLCDASGTAPTGDDQPTILFFGRIWEYKGLEYLIRAEPLITAKVPGARIVIAGEGEDFGRYRSVMTHPERFVVYNEHITDEVRSELFRRASVVVLPYIEASQSGVIPIAYSFMKPVVATNVGGLPEMVDDGGTGFLVPRRDERALADAIVRLLCDAPLRLRMGMNGQRKLETECAPSVVARQTLAVYHRTVNSPRRSCGLSSVPDHSGHAAPGFNPEPRILNPSCKSHRSPSAAVINDRC